MSSSIGLQHPSTEVASFRALGRVVQEVMVALRDAVESLLKGGLPSTPGQMYDFERALHSKVGRDCVDRIVGQVIKDALASEEVRATAAALLGRYDGVRLQKADQEVEVRLLGGSTTKVKVPYFLQRTAPTSGRRRQVEGNGVYPTLAAIGIHYRVTPALAEEVGRLAIQGGSYQQARETLAMRGVTLDIKTVHRLVLRLGERALRHREWLDDLTNRQSAQIEWGQDRRLVIGTDGGRVRTRWNHAEIETGKKRRGFTPRWREPKVLVIYAVDDKGCKERKQRCIYDATMGDADALFRILASLLSRIGAAQAREWVFIGDGALWIWNRLDELVERVGYDRKRVTPVVDYYHACEHLNEIAKAAQGWTEKEQKAWYHRTKGELYNGKIEKVLGAMAKVPLPPRTSNDSEGLPADPLAYFAANVERMRYRKFREKGIPIGSGAVESAVRRLVNLRLKSNGSFWDIDNAEMFLHLRAQFLGRDWISFVKTVLDHEVFWGNKHRCTCKEAVAA